MLTLWPSRPIRESISRLISGSLEIPEAWLRNRKYNIEAQGLSEQAVLKSFAGKLAESTASAETIKARAEHCALTVTEKYQKSRESVSRRTLEYLADEKLSDEASALVSRALVVSSMRRGRPRDGLGHDAVFAHALTEQVAHLIVCLLSRCAYSRIAIFSHIPVLSLRDSFSVRLHPVSPSSHYRNRIKCLRDILGAGSALHRMCDGLAPPPE